ncbi:MAG: hypothetical protein ACMUHB_06125 [Thermoplasmatota archaeon]
MTDDIDNREEADIFHLDMDDPVLRSVIPYVQDPSFILEVLEDARISGDAAAYIEGRLREAPPGRKGDMRILLNAVTRQRIS